jgi:S1-C subfamily serine protease
MNTPRTRLAVAAAVLFFVATGAPAADVASQAREVLAGARKSLITVSAYSKLDLGGMPIRLSALAEAQESSCSGLVIDASGLTVVSYSALNPMERLVGALKSRLSEASVAAKTELSRVQMRLEDGTEIPARLVLKDKELDLAFLVPDPKEGEKAPQLSPVKLAAGAAAKELDDVVVVSRHGKDLGYQPIVTLGQVTSLIVKPRAMYDLSVAPRPGSPAFLPDGQLLGVTVSFSAGDGLASLSAREALVLPTAEIAKLADQARKAAEKKKDTKKNS